MKILILLPYFNRPLLVRNALNSILRANEHHQDWHLLFGDDNSKHPGEPVAKQILADYLHKVTFVNSQTTLELKLDHGLKIGEFANEVLAKTDADICVVLCDDDELHPLYLKNLSEFFVNHPSVNYCYSQIHLYNPLFQKSNLVNALDHKYNHQGPINPVNNLDISQVAFRIPVCRKEGIQFPSSTIVGNQPCILNIDGEFFQQLFDKFGPAEPTGFVSQYKGIHDYQLVWRKKDEKEAFRRYINDVESLSGKLL